MFDVTINYWAVLVATVASMVVGFLWYSKALFGKAWMETIGKTEEELKKNANPMMYVGTFVLALVEAYVLAHVVAYVDAVTVWDGIVTGFWMWLGFVVTTHSVDAIFNATPTKRLMISMGYHLVYLVIAGAILAAWV